MVAREFPLTLIRQNSIDLKLEKKILLLFSLLLLLYVRIIPKFLIFIRDAEKLYA